MIIDSEDYIKTSMVLYLEDLVKVTENVHMPIELQPLIDYSLAGTLLKMTGFIEKKIDMISWNIASRDFEYRNILIHSHNDYTADIKTLNSIYKKLCGNDNIDRNGIMSESDFQQKAYNKITNIFKNSNFINYTNSDFMKFKILCAKKIDVDKLKKLYTNTLDYRHSIAHNINSVYRDHLSIQQMGDNECLYSNYYAMFMILLFVDYVLISRFQTYTSLLGKIRWL